MRGRAPVVDQLGGGCVSATTSVYRYYDKHGRLIYVGITSRGVKRNREHNESKDWWQYVARQEVSHCDNREAAATLEKELIQTYKPPFNTAHNAGWQEVRQDYEDTMSGPTEKEQAAWSMGWDSGYEKGLYSGRRHNEYGDAWYRLLGNVVDRTNQEFRDSYEAAAGRILASSRAVDPPEYVESSAW